MSHKHGSNSCSGTTTLADEHGFLVTESCGGNILLRVGFVTMQLPPHALEQLGVTLVRASMKLRSKDAPPASSTSSIIEPNKEVVH
tara:strand:+ start:47 stop:304 length:258 start_codon:yes stop_codon:yes gene_type:complete